MGLTSVTQLAHSPDDPLIVVPARVSSGRFPAKAMATIAGASVIRHVVDRIREATDARLLVATDSPAIASEVEGSCQVVIVDEPGLACGSDRVAAAVRALEASAHWIVNVQGDEACLPAAALRALLAALPTARAPMVTACLPMTGREGQESTDVVKAVLAEDGRARDFVRGSVATNVAATWFRHVGLYAFTAEALREFAAMPASDRERAEGLEQLRAVEAGWPIDVVVLGDYRDRPWPSINRSEDLEAAERYLAGRRGVAARGQGKGDC